MVKAVFFDIGGVVMESPFPAIFEFERKNSLPKGTLARIISKGGPQGSFSKLERSEISYSQFVREFEEECKRLGFLLSAKDFLQSIEGYVRKANPKMIQAIKVIRSKGIKTCAVTNNWFNSDEAFNNYFSKQIDNDEASKMIHELFDCVVESRKVRINKPDPQIYLLACSKLDVKPEHVVFLDDIGSNLKSASKLGMKTIRVHINKVDEALKELESILEFTLKSKL